MKSSSLPPDFPTSAAPAGAPPIKRSRSALTAALSSATRPCRRISIREGRSIKRGSPARMLAASVMSGTACVLRKPGPARSIASMTAFCARAMPMSRSARWAVVRFMVSPGCAVWTGQDSTALLSGAPALPRCGFSRLQGPGRDFLIERVHKTWHARCVALAWGSPYSARAGSLDREIGHARPEACFSARARRFVGGIFSPRRGCRAGGDGAPRGETPVRGSGLRRDHRARQARAGRRPRRLHRQPADEDEPRPAFPRARGLEESRRSALPRRHRGHEPRLRSGGDAREQEGRHDPHRAGSLPRLRDQGGRPHHRVGIRPCAIFPRDGGVAAGAARRRARPRPVVRRRARGEARAAQENRRAVGRAAATLGSAREYDLALPHRIHSSPHSGLPRSAEENIRFKLRLTRVSALALASTEWYRYEGKTSSVPFLTRTTT